MAVTRALAFHDEVDFLSSVPPIVKLTLTCCGGIGKMRADRGFDQPSAEFPPPTPTAVASAGTPMTDWRLR
jgi:hypothetical protein